MRTTCAQDRSSKILLVQGDPVLLRKKEGKQTNPREGLPPPIPRLGYLFSFFSTLTRQGRGLAQTSTKRNSPSRHIAGVGRPRPWSGEAGSPAAPRPLSSRSSRRARASAQPHVVSRREGRGESVDRRDLLGLSKLRGQGHHHRAWRARSTTTSG